MEDTGRWAVLPVETLNALPDIIDRLEGNSMQAWKSARQHGAFDEIEDFARQIKAFGKRCALNVLETFGSNLLTHVDNFDIDPVEAGLEAYPQLIERLKHPDLSHQPPWFIIDSHFSKQTCLSVTGDSRD